ncbi:MAG: acylphosphatase [Salibacteraceae bacterium]
MYLHFAEMAIKAIEIRVYGKVQGVWFRKYTMQKAKELGVSGFVKNQPDGSVCIHAEGDEQVLEALTEWCYKGSPQARVTRVETSSVKPLGVGTFEIRY